MEPDIHIAGLPRQKHAERMLLRDVFVQNMCKNTWEPIVNANLRIMKGHVYLSICDCKTLHHG